MGADIRAVPLAPRQLERDQAFCESFWSRVDRSGGPQACWLWRGCLNDKRYGAVRLPTLPGQRDRTVAAHRVAYWLDRLQEPTGQQVLRHGDGCGLDRHCCNPAHLTIGTRQQNCDDAVRLGRVGRGPSHYSAITTDQIERIRLMLLSDKTMAMIARHVGCSLQTVSDIRQGRHWSCREAKSISREVA